MKDGPIPPPQGSFLLIIRPDGDVVNDFLPVHPRALVSFGANTVVTTNISFSTWITHVRTLRQKYYASRMSISTSNMATKASEPKTTWNVPFHLAAVASQGQRIIFLLKVIMSIKPITTTNKGRP